MNVVFDTLFLRKFRLEYTCPPICITQFSNASGAPISGSSTPAIILTPISPLTAPVLPGVVGLCGNFMQWPIYPRQICYSVYFVPGVHDIAGPYSPILECIPAGSIAICSAGYYKISALTSAGETPAGAPFLVDGSQYVIANLPQVAGAYAYRLYKNPDVTNIGGTYTLYFNSFSGNAFETCAAGCYRVSAVTPDGETPLSNPICLTPDCGGQFSPTCPPGYQWNGIECVHCVDPGCPTGSTWDPAICECVDNYGNDLQTGSLVCPTNPAITVSGSVPARTFTSRNPADYPWKLNSMAQQALAAALFFDLEAAGCCPGSGVQFTDSGTINNDTNCSITFSVHNPNGTVFDAPYGNSVTVGPHSSVNWPIYLHSLEGSPISAGRQGYFTGYGLTVGFTCIGTP